MPNLRHSKPISELSRLVLRWAVHWDAFWASPANYARAARWWIAGKKLRARLQFAPLLGRSPRAYRLWQAQRHLLYSEPEAPMASEVSVLALIASGEGIALTMESCAREGVEAMVIDEPKQLANIDLADHEWVLPLSAGDTLADGAGAHYRNAATQCDAAVHVIYSDDDECDGKTGQKKPHLKPDWNSELFKFHDYITGAAILRTKDLKSERRDPDDWVAILTHQAIAACEDAGGEPQHLHRVLHHRHARPAPKAPVEANPSPDPQECLPTISVIVPTRNRLDLLRVCLKGLLQTDYPGVVDVIVIDNGSDDPATLEYLSALDEDFARVLRDDGPFNFAALNNNAVKRANGELLCFLNNDIEVCEPDWLATLARQALRDDVGAVGARLLYPDGRIQHAGVVTGIGGAAAHAHRGLWPDEEGYFHRHSLPQFVSAVTAACMVVRRDRFDVVGGFDAQTFAVSFNDVDLCLRLAEQGWRSLYEPRATLVHHESVSRGLDHDPQGAARQGQEVASLQNRWKTGLVTSDSKTKGADPYHHPGLNPLSEHFVLRL